MPKFTKEDALKELMGAIPNKGENLNLSERSINEQLETLMPLLAGEETELSDFIKSVLPIFKTADTNVRNDISAGIKDYKEKNPLPPKKVEKPTEGEDSDLSKALKRIEELEKKNAESEHKSLLSQRRSEIISKMSEKGCKDKEWINGFLEDVNLEGDEFDADARAEKYINMYNKAKSYSPNNVTPKPAGGGSGDNKSIENAVKQAAEFVKRNKLA